MKNTQTNVFSKKVCPVYMNISVLVKMLIIGAPLTLDGPISQNHQVGGRAPHPYTCMSYTHSMLCLVCAYVYTPSLHGPLHPSLVFSQPHQARKEKTRNVYGNLPMDYIQCRDIHVCASFVPGSLYHQSFMWDAIMYIVHLKLTHSPSLYPDSHQGFIQRVGVEST